MSLSNPKEIDWRRVITDALPYFLRKPLILALLFAALSPLRWLYTKVLERRAGDLYQLQHNGQVCSLLGMLEERYPSALGIHYRIEDITPQGRVVYAVRESSLDIAVPLLGPSEASTLVTSSEHREVDPTSFTVYVPRDIYDSLLSEVQWIIERYKLPTKHPIYSPTDH